MCAYHEPSVLSIWTPGRQSRSRSGLVTSEVVRGVGGGTGEAKGWVGWAPLSQGRALSRLHLSSPERRENGILAEAVHTCLATMEVILNLVTADASQLSPPTTVSAYLHTHTYTDILSVLAQTALGGIFFLL